MIKIKLSYIDKIDYISIYIFPIFCCVGLMPCNALVEKKNLLKQVSMFVFAYRTPFI
jgi:hypothetical protein